ncbi:MAG: hypothetical protein HDT47_01485 [Ruminococcaceae bacterium]|nr:hypothetical protein [Oscillospiraceae bacterium]
MRFKKIMVAAITLLIVLAAVLPMTIVNAVSGERVAGLDKVIVQDYEDMFEVMSLQDGIEATLTTDKEEYLSDEPITATLTVKNTSDTAIVNVSLESLIPEEYKLADDSVATKQIDVLNASESVTLIVTYVPKTPPKPEVTTQPKPEVTTQPESKVTTQPEPEVSNSDGSKQTDVGDIDNTESAQPDTGDNNDDVSVQPDTNNNDGNNTQIVTGDDVESNPNTGVDSNITFLFVLTLLTDGIIIVILKINKKKRNTILSIFLCLAIISSLVAILPVSATAFEADEVTTQTIEISEVVLVADETVEVKAIVTYRLPDIQEDTFTVTFESNGGSKVASQTVSSGDQVICPTNPVRDGYIFVGWYSDSKLTVLYDFDSVVTENITLYARWTNEDNLTDDIIDLGDIEELISNGIIEVIFDNNGNIRTIDGTFTDTLVNTAADAAEVLNSASSLFGDSFFADPQDITVQSVIDGEADEERFFRLSNNINGVPVLGSQIIIAANSAGKVSGLFSTYNNSINYVNTAPSIDIEQACSIAIEHLLSTPDVDEYLSGLVTDDMGKNTVIEAFKAAITIDPELLIYAVDDAEQPALVYAVKISGYSTSIGLPTDYSDDRTEIVEDIVEIGDEDEIILRDGEHLDIDLTYYIYANDYNASEIYSVTENNEGTSIYVIHARDLGNTERTFYAQGNNGTYWLRDSIRNLETYKTTFGGFLWTQPQLPGQLVEFRTTLNRTAVSAHANMSDVYDYYSNILGRQSYDGYDAKIVVSYDYDDINLIFTGNYANAFWSSSLQQMVFGDAGNYAAALDVAGHEFTHAVINYVVGDGASRTLTYSGESGALNEAYADILGNLIEGKTNSGRWLIAEDSDGAIRSMEDPSLYYQPEHYNSRYTGTGDNGGVHTNSGIFNFAAYKMMTDSRTSDILQTTWAKVFYRSLYRLTTNATFLDARGAIISSAKAIGFTQAQQQAIKDAFDAVGIVETDSLRIVLKWGETPYDLDSHIVGPSVIGDGRFHVYYEQSSYYTDGSYYSEFGKYAVDLDYDDTTSFGPEVTTIHVFTPGIYYFYVHDYSTGTSETSTAMANSGANVNVYRGSSNTAIASFTIDTESSGTYWNVFMLTIEENGIINISPINAYGGTATLS